jgi:hypothetical protein
VCAAPPWVTRRGGEWGVNALIKIGLFGGGRITVKKWFRKIHPDDVRLSRTRA